MYSFEKFIFYLSDDVSDVTATGICKCLSVHLFICSSVCLFVCVLCCMCLCVHVCLPTYLSITDQCSHLHFLDY